MQVFGGRRGRRALEFLGLQRERDALMATHGPI